MSGEPAVGYITLYHALPANHNIHKYLPDKLPCYLSDSRLRYTGGFGISENLTKNIEWSEFSTLKIIKAPNNQKLYLHEIDFNALNMIWNCDQVNLSTTNKIEKIKKKG